MYLHANAKLELRRVERVVTAPTRNEDELPAAAIPLVVQLQPVAFRVRHAPMFSRVRAGEPSDSGIARSRQS
jgi:hypothetical protein